MVQRFSKFAVCAEMPHLDPNIVISDLRSMRNEEREMPSVDHPVKLLDGEDLTASLVLDLTLVLPRCCEGSGSVSDCLLRSINGAMSWVHRRLSRLGELDRHE